MYQDGTNGTEKDRQSLLVTPLTGSIPKRAMAAGGLEVTANDVVAALLHSVRVTLPLCPPTMGNSDGLRAMSTAGDVQRCNYMSGMSQYGLGIAPVSDEDLLTTERFSHSTEFEIGGKLRIQTFAPALFIRILTWCGTTPEEYLEDWCGALEDSTMEASRGKSQSEFMFSSSKKFIIKTIKETEYNSIRQILRSYFAYLLENPNSLINKIVGAYAVQRNKSERKYFIVIPNVLTPGAKFSRVYDLKGSTFNRAAGEAEKNSAVPHLKDNDFLNDKTKIQINPVNQRILVQQLQNDVTWLQGRKRMDYSILVGVCETPVGESSSTSGLNVIRGTFPDVSYHIGIIDILQEYNIKKQVAHTLKTTVGGADDKELSTVPSDQYGERFLGFIQNSLEKSRDTTLNFFLNPRQIAARKQSAIHKDGSIGVGDVVGRTFNEVITLDISSPNVKSLCVVSEVRKPATNSFENTDEPSDDETELPAGCLSDTRQQQDENISDMLLYSCHLSSNVTVNVVGPVACGDVLIPSGNSNGTAVAVPMSCKLPNYILGVVVSVPGGDYEPNACATKFTAVRAIICEMFMRDPNFEWQVLEVVPVETSTVQAMWVTPPRELSIALTRCCVLNPFGNSMMRISNSWLSVDWLSGDIVKEQQTIPVRGLGNQVANMAAEEIKRRKMKTSKHIERTTQGGFTLSMNKIPSFGYTASGNGEDTELVSPRVVEEESLSTPRTKRLVRKAERSIKGLLRDWLVSIKSSNSIANKQAAQVAAVRYRENQCCLITRLFKTKGLFRHVLFYLNVPDIGRVSRVCAQWAQQSSSPELWQHILELHHITNISSHCSQPLKGLYTGRRRCMLFKIGEYWEEEYGLRFPEFGYSKRGLLKLIEELSVYDLIFQKHLSPHRTLTDFVLFRREAKTGVDVGMEHIWEMDKAMQVMWPHLKRKWLRSAVTARFTLIDNNYPETSELESLRLKVLSWLTGRKIQAVTWEDSSLLVTFHTKKELNEVLNKHKQDMDIEFVVSQYTSLQLCRNVRSWKEVKKRVWETIPGGPSSSLRPPNNKMLPLPTRVSEEYENNLGKLTTLRETLSEYFERHLFPSDKGNTVNGEAEITDRPERSVEIFEVRESEKVRLAGQIFPVFVVTSHAVLAMVEINDSPPQLNSMQSARQHPLGHIRIEGHGGLKHYLLCAMVTVKCTEESLKRLLLSIDMIVNGKGTTSSTLTVAVEGQKMPDGTTYTHLPLWVCDDLQEHKGEILEVLSGHKDALEGNTNVQEMIYSSIQGCITEEVDRFTNHDFGDSDDVTTMTNVSEVLTTNGSCKNLPSLCDNRY